MNALWWPQVEEQGPAIERMLHRDTLLRTLRVKRVERLASHRVRVTLGGEELDGFHSFAPDDHLELRFLDASGREARRSYTVRRHDPVQGTLAIDFALHDTGPASSWARTARPGDLLRIAGPSGSAMAPTVRRWLLIGDETALPAIARRIEEAAADTVVTSLVGVAGAADRPAFDTQARLDARWVYRPRAEAHRPDAWLAAARELVIEPDTFLWVAAEASVVHALHRHLVDERRHAAGWFRFASYWVAGRADGRAWPAQGA